MKFLLSVLFLALPSVGFASDCVLKKELKGQKLFECQSPQMPRSLKVLDLKGGFSETAYYHGYFLRSEIERGVLEGVQVRTARAFAALDEGDREQLLLVKKCIIDNYRNAASDEFKAGIKNLYRGMIDAGSKVPWKTFEESNYMTEASIYFDSMERQLAENPGKAKKKIFASCAPYFIGKAIWKPFKTLAQGLRSLKMGCTGISASAASTRDGALLHGRNFDTGLLGYYELDQVAVINRQLNGITSVGIATAGLHYAGGISGFNNQGLAVSLHELQTTGTKIHHERGSSDVAPFLLHSVLMKARTLDQAIGMIQTRKGFGAWTFFISDSKTDEAASIEMSGDTVVVARRTQGQFMGQSNHFVAAATQKEGYEYSLNKTLESRARLTHVTRTLGEDAGKIDFQWVINRLSGHEDELVGARSFGRTTTKVYTAATHVMVPGRQQWWMSLAETYPTHRSHFVGFQLNEKNSSSPVTILGVTKAWEDPGKTAWYDSMKYYVQAYLANEQDKKTLAGIDRTLALLDQAVQKARESQIEEFPYHFMWARMKVYRAARAQALGQQELAADDLIQAQDRLTEIRQSFAGRLHPYEQFQTLLWTYRAEALKPAVKQNSQMLLALRSESLRILQSLKAQYPQQRELTELEQSLLLPAALEAVLEADIRLGTVE